MQEHLEKMKIVVTYQWILMLIEKERGITILAKTTAINYKGYSY